MTYKFTALSPARKFLSTGVLVFLAVFLAGCSFGPAKSTAKPSPSPSPKATATPPPTPGPLPAGVTCAGKRAAASMVMAGNQLWDSTAPAAPVSLCTFSGAGQLRSVADVH